MTNILDIECDIDILMKDIKSYIADNKKIEQASGEVCPRCKGRGKIKSKEIVALSILRSIKYATTDKQINVVTVETTPDLSDYLLNFKRREISQIEKLASFIGRVV